MIVVLLKRMFIANNLCVTRRLPGDGFGNSEQTRRRQETVMMNNIDNELFS